MTLKIEAKRSKLRDLLIIIRLFICCIAIVLVNWLIYVVQRLRSCIQNKSDTFNAQRKEPQSAACIKDEDKHPKIFLQFQQRCDQGANQAKKKQRTQHKKRSGTGRRNVNCSCLQPPPVEELIFTRNDVWRTKNDTSKLTQNQVQLYSSDSVKMRDPQWCTHQSQQQG